MGRMVRMGIDVGGTHTKAVAIDNETHEIIGKSSVKTTHDDPRGVAAGVVKCFKNCLMENNISPDDVVFVAHSTTQATNALIEGDVAKVGLIGMAKGGLEGFLAKKQTNLANIDLGNNKEINIINTFINTKKMTEQTVHQVIEELTAQGAQVIVPSMAFGVDNGKPEQMVFEKRPSYNDGFRYYKIIWINQKNKNSRN
jgi:N-methylhydantoinase A/oxoprolinase/acetone carboxylase beta subunit